MLVARHWLAAGGSRIRLARRPTPNLGGAMQPRLVVIHYTADTSAAGALDWLCNPQSGVSAHLLIARADGAVTQLAPFDRITWHAGRSAWDGRDNVNDFAIGIELDNAGRLVAADDGWRSESGAAIPAGEVATAPLRGESAPTGWHRFGERQIESLVEVLAAIRRAYPIAAIVGHDDVAPGRKIDPGPVFPMDHVRAASAVRAAAPPPRLWRRLAARLGF